VMVRTEGWLSDGVLSAMAQWWSAQSDGLVAGGALSGMAQWWRFEP